MLATPSDVATMMLSTFNAQEEALVQMLIEGGQAEIETWVGKPVEIQEFEERAFPDPDGAIYLKNRPVRAITSLVVSGKARDADYLTTTDYGLEHFFWHVPHIRSFDANEINVDTVFGGDVHVVYEAGLGGVAAKTAKSILIRAITRRMYDVKARKARDAMGQTFVRNFAVEDYSVGFERSNVDSDRSEISLFDNIDKDLEALRRYKRIGAQ